MINYSGATAVPYDLTEDKNLKELNSSKLIYRK
jgi:hypothetical protein